MMAAVLHIREDRRFVGLRQGVPGVSVCAADHGKNRLKSSLPMTTKDTNASCFLLQDEGKACIYAFFCMSENWHILCN